MPATHGLNARLYLGGADVSTFFKSASVDSSKDTVDTTAFGSASKTYIPGLRDATASLEGMFDNGVSGGDAILRAALESSSNLQFSMYPEGAALGNFGFGLSGIQTSHAISASTDDVVQASAEIQSSTGAERLQSVADKGAVAATGPLTTVDSGAATTTGGVGYLHVFVSGTSVTVKIQDSVDGTTWTDLITFVAATSSQAQRIPLAGGATVKRYLRANVTALTGGPATIQVGVGRTVPTLP
jgi:hypothetical protein